MAEERPDEQDRSVRDALDEWREAERDAEAEKPGSAAHRMARMRANHARDDFHEAEDEARERQGNYRPRRKAHDPA